VTPFEQLTSDAPTEPAVFDHFRRFLTSLQHEIRGRHIITASKVVAGNINQMGVALLE
jgi:hypothetical protein